MYFLIKNILRQKFEIEYSFGAQHIKDAPAWILVLGNYTVIGVLSFLLIIYHLKKNQLPNVLLTALLTFVCFSKVLSPQFFIWFLPLMIFFIEEKVQLALFSIIAALSGYIFIHYGELMAQAPWAWWSLSLRNVLIIIWFGMRLRNHITDRSPSNNSN